MAGPQTIGIQIDVRENASLIAPKVIQQIEGIGEAGEKAGQQVQAAFDPSKLGAGFDAFAEKIDKLYETKFGRERELKMRYMELRNQQLEQRMDQIGRGAPGPAARFISRGGMTAGRVGGAVAEMGETGGAMGAGAGILESLGGMVSKAGPVGAAIAAVVGVVAVSAIVMDKLVKTYEPFIGQLMDTTGALGGLGKSAEENSRELRKNLEDAGTAAAKFGYSLEVGSDILNQLAHGGIGRGAALGREGELFAYARGFGVQPGNLVAAQILAQRYGQGNVLGLAAGGTALSGMGPGRYEEYLRAMTSIFEESIAKGVGRGFESISATLNFFGRVLGPMWQGQQGAQKLMQMGQAVTGATALQSETDVLLYRAARNAVQGARPGDLTATQLAAPGYIRNMIELEKGVTVPLFKNIYDQIRMMTGGNDVNMINMLRQTFGVNYGMATQLWMAGKSNLSQADLSKLVEKLPPPGAESPELQLMHAEQDLRLQIIKTGEALLAGKTELVKEMDRVVTALAYVAGGAGMPAPAVGEGSPVERFLHVGRGAMGVTAPPPPPQARATAKEDIDKLVRSLDANTRALLEKDLPVTVTVQGR